MQGEAYLLPGASACRVVGVEYEDGSRTTVFAPRSMEDAWAADESWSCCRSKTEAIEDWAFDVTVVPEKRVLTFKTQNVLTSNDEWSFDFATGELTQTR